ncbi:MAG TPA: hypothetical protein VKR26_19080 [Terriglobales bacterium]|nr:hypothetical protein [Terriglobales bacterium]
MEGKHRDARNLLRDVNKAGGAAAAVPPPRLAPVRGAEAVRGPVLEEPQLPVLPARVQNVPPAPAEKAAAAHARAHPGRSRAGSGRKARAAIPAPVRGGVRPDLLRQRKDDPDPPQPPGQQPPAPVEEPPDSPQSNPPAPVREPGPAPPKRMQV